MSAQNKMSKALEHIWELYGTWEGMVRRNLLIPGLGMICQPGEPMAEKTFVIIFLTRSPSHEICCSVPGTRYRRPRSASFLNRCLCADLYFVDLGICYACVVTAVFVLSLFSMSVRCISEYVYIYI